MSSVIQFLIGIGIPIAAFIYLPKEMSGLAIAVASIGGVLAGFNIVPAVRFMRRYKEKTAA